jgi:hypothetical protein
VSEKFLGMLVMSKYLKAYPMNNLSQKELLFLKKFPEGKDRTFRNWHFGGTPLGLK